MWKMGFRSRGKENQEISNPVLIDTSYDNRSPNKIRKHRDLVGAAQSARPSDPQQPLRPLSNAASSVYSQPTPKLPYEHWQSQNGPSLPYGEYDVSPVEEEGSFSFSGISKGSTNATYQHSPPPSPPPTIPAQYSTPSGQAHGGPGYPTSAMPSLLFERRQPAPSIRTVASTLTTGTTGTARKPVPSPAGAITNNKRSQTLPFSSSGTPTPTTSKPSTPRSATPTTNKSLPPPPPVSAADPADGRTGSPDPLGKFTAQLDDLMRRRTNINRIIRDLTNLPPLQNPLVTDIATRNANERKVKALEEELAEIGREEHEIGMKLHRARKRVEREEGNDCGTTALWVRRVTNPA